MIPTALAEFFQGHQELLWIATVFLDLSLTLLMYRLFGRIGLTAAIVLAILLANLQGPKLTIIFGMETSLGVIFYSSIFFCTDVLGEKHGRAVANQAVLTGFGVSLIIVLMLSISMLYQPSTQPNTAALASGVHAAFGTILNFTPRFVFGSLLAYLISQSLDVWLFHRIRSWTEGRHLWLRNNGSGGEPSTSPPPSSSGSRNTCSSSSSRRSIRHLSIGCAIGECPACSKTALKHQHSSALNRKVHVVPQAWHNSARRRNTNEQKSPGATWRPRFAIRL